MALSSFGFLVLTVCLALASAACIALSILVALPPISGALAIAFGAMTFVNPTRDRFYAGIVLIESVTTVALGVAYLFHDPAALLTVVVFYAWPVLLIVAGSALVVGWHPRLA